MIIAVGEGAKIATLELPELGELLKEPLMTLERVRVCKRDGQARSTTPHELPGTDERGLALWQKLMVYTSHSQRCTEVTRSIREIIRRLRESDAAGVTRHYTAYGAFMVRTRRMAIEPLQLRRHVPVVHDLRSTHPNGSRTRSRSSTRSPPSTVWSRARSSRR